MRLGKTLKRKRLDKGLTQTELANKIGVSQQAICRFESDTKTPSLPLLEQMAKALDTTASDLLK